MLKFLCRSNKGLLISMVQDDNFPLLSIKRSEKTLIDNEMVQYDVYVEVDGEAIKLMELNKFKIKLINSNPLYWWKQGKKDTEQYKVLTATIKANNAEVLTNKNRMAELQKEIGLTGLTMGQLQG